MSLPGGTGRAGAGSEAAGEGRAHRPFGSQRDSADDLDARVRAHLEGELEIVRTLRDGSVARVYLARDAGLGRLVAVKVLRPERASAESLSRFEREARAAAALAHPNVVAVHRFGRLAGGEPYLVMQYVSGQTLEERLAAEGPLAAGEVRRIVADLAGALAAAHAHGVVHRDVRPGNIAWDGEAGRALLMDFGIAALTEEWPSEAEPLTRNGQVLGDPRYLSPEQLRSQPVTGAADVYSLALVAHELLTGGVPHAGESRQRLVRERIAGAAAELPGDVARQDPGLADLLRRCLAPEPRHRPTAESVARVAAAPPDADAGPGPPLIELPAASRLWRALRRRRMPQWIGGVAAAGWVLLEVVSQLDQQGVLPSWVYAVALSGVIAALAATAVLAWFHGARGPQRPRAVETVLLAVIGVLWVLGLIAIAVFR